MCTARTRACVSLLASLGLLICLQPTGAQADDDRLSDAQWSFEVNAQVALSSLLSLGDGHLQKMADSLQMLAAAESARSGEWDSIKGPFAELAKRNVSALNWFALPDGSYWSLQDGKEEGNLSHREYFPKVLAGETVLGELVMSTATGKPVAIIAVPVFGPTGAVNGVLGASVYLDALSETIRQQMGIDEGMIFYSFDHNALVALIWDRQLIFFEPRKSGDEGLVRAFDEMLAREEGVVSYTFRGHERTVAYRRSPLTGWWYAFGIEAGPDKPPAAQVEARETAFAKTMAERDLEAFASFIASEAVFSSGEEPLRGRDAIVAAWARFFAGPEAPFSWQPDLVRVLGSGTMAFSSGPVRDPSGKEIGRFNSIWRKEADGQWRVMFDKGS
jgi:ketosteroid isomerase-like protein